MSTFFKQVPRNAALLVSLLILIVLSPSIGEDLSGYVVELVFDAILLAGVYSVGPGKHRWPFLVLTVVTLAVRWGEHLSGVPALDVGALSITVLWLAYAVSIIIGHLFQRRDVTVDTILGSIVAYLLIAVGFTLGFEIIELQNPGSFSGLADGGAGDRAKLGSSMMYFSLVCITTMGFGDVVPVSNIARPLAVLEGVFGQLYLAVMIARLVGLHIAGAGGETKSGKEL
jgi:hypothetical protein